MLDHGDSGKMEHMTVSVSFGINQAKSMLNMVKTCEKWDILELLEKETKARQDNATVNMLVEVR